MAKLAQHPYRTLSTRKRRGHVCRAGFAGRGMTVARERAVPHSSPI